MNQALPTNAPMGNGTADLPLRDIHLPDPVGLWPLAPGWWALLLLVLLITIATIFYFRAKQRALAYRKEALVGLKQLTEHYKSLELNNINNEPQLIVLKQEYLEKINALLKRTALTAYPNATHLALPALSGEQWAKFLYGQCPALHKHTSITEQTLAELMNTKYQKAPIALTAVSFDTLNNFAHYWICHHAKASTNKISTNPEIQSNTVAPPSSAAAGGG